MPQSASSRSNFSDFLNVGLLTLVILTSCHWWSNEHSPSLAVLSPDAKNILYYPFFFLITFSCLFDAVSPCKGKTDPISFLVLYFWGVFFSRLYSQGQAWQYIFMEISGRILNTPSSLQTFLICLSQSNIGPIVKKYFK